MASKNTVLGRHVDAMFTHLDNGNNSAVLNEYDKIEKKLSNPQYKQDHTCAHIVLKAIALHRQNKNYDARALVQKLRKIYEENFSSKAKAKVAAQPAIEQKPQNGQWSTASGKGRKGKQNRKARPPPANAGFYGFAHRPHLYQDRQAIDALSFYYANEAYDYEALCAHWTLANEHFPDNMEYKAQLFMAQVRCIEPIKMKSTALKLYKLSKSQTPYLCWAVMAMLTEQAMAEPEMNDEEYFSPIARNPPPAKNKLLSNLAIKLLERNFDQNNGRITTTGEAKLYLMANEASGNDRAVLELYEARHQYLSAKKSATNDESVKAIENKLEKMETGDKETGKGDSVAKTDGNNNNVIPQAPYRHDVIKCEAYLNIGEYETVETLSMAFIKRHGSDSWPFLLTLCTVADKCPERRAGIEKYIQELVDAETAKPDKYLRSPYLAQLELANRFKDTSDERVLELMKDYISRFSTSIILFEDIDKYLSSLIDQNPDRLSSLLTFIKNFDFKCDDIKTQRRKETAMILLRYRLNDFDVVSSEEDVKNFQKSYEQCLKDCPSDCEPMHVRIKTASSPVTALMSNPEPYVGDAYLLVVAQTYLRKYFASGYADKKLLWKSCVLLEQLLDLSPANQHIRLILVMLYVWELGAWDAGYELMKEVDIKHVQCETLGYVLTRWGHCIGNSSKAQVISKQVINFKVQSTYEAKDNVIAAFHGGIFDKVFEMMDYVRKVERSLHARYCEVELMFYHWLDKQENISMFRQDYETSDQIDLANEKPTLELEFTVDAKDLTDSRDLGLFDDWRADAIERTKNSQNMNRSETQAWVIFREALANLYLLWEKPVLAAGEERDGYLKRTEACVSTVGEAYEAGMKLFEKNSTLEVPLRLRTEWHAASAIPYPAIIANITGLVNLLPGLTMTSVSEAVDRVLDDVNKYLAPCVDASVFRMMVDDTDYFYSDPNSVERIRLACEIFTIILQRIGGHLPDTKNARRNLAKKYPEFTKNMESISKLTGAIDGVLLNFQNGIEEQKAQKFYKAPGDCTAFDVAYAEKVVFSKMSTSVLGNMEKWKTLVSSIRFQVSSLK